MSEMRDLLGESLRRLLEQQCALETVQAWDGGAPPPALWAALEELGLPLLLVPEAAGGAGGDLADAVEVLRLCGAAFAPLPLGETLLAGALLAVAGVTPPAGSLALSFESLPRGPWLGRTDHIVALREDGFRLLPGDAAEAAAATLADEPRGVLSAGAAALAEGALPAGRSAEEVFALAALLRAAQLSGAMERVVAMAAAHVAEREQFGRPLNRFQAVQHALVRAAGECAAAGIAVEAAAAAGSGDSVPLFEIALAKARASEAAGIVAAVVHQLHGAIGFTRDLPLNLGTRRLWAWREDYGNETFWQQWLGRRIAARGGDALWPALTRNT